MTVDLEALERLYEDRGMHSVNYSEIAHMVPAILSELRTLREDAVRTATCKWVDNDDFWSTSCGRDFVLNDGTPKENGMRYCYHCGKPLAAHDRRKKNG